MNFEFSIKYLYPCVKPTNLSQDEVNLNLNLIFFQQQHNRKRMLYSSCSCTLYIYKEKGGKCHRHVTKILGMLSKNMICKNSFSGY